MVIDCTGYAAIYKAWLIFDYEFYTVPLLAQVIIVPKSQSLKSLKSPYVTGVAIVRS